MLVGVHYNVHIALFSLSSQSNPASMTILSISTTLMSFSIPGLLFPSSQINQQDNIGGHLPGLLVAKLALLLQWCTSQEICKLLWQSIVSISKISGNFFYYPGAWAAR